MQSKHCIKAVAAGAVATLALGACASNPVPDEKVAVAQAAVQHAQSAGAADLATVELAAAQDKLKEAQAAAAKHRGRDAIALAERANVDAEVAEATAQEKHSQQAANEVDASLEALRQGSAGAAGGSPPGAAGSSSPPPSNP